MFCESWRETLSAAAVSGEALPREAQAHLAACASCRAALADEQQLFALMDSGLRSIANIETPASLLPKVRAQIAEPPPVKTWWIPVLAFATTAVALVAVVIFSHVSRTKEQSATAVVSPEEIRRANRASVPPIQTAETPVPLQNRKGNTPVHKVVAQPSPDIIVSTDEQTSLQTYLSRFRARAGNSVALVMAKTEPTAEIKPLEISEIKMPQLTIEQLQAGESK
jgi:anti-sigma factor RsiW